MLPLTGLHCRTLPAQCARHWPLVLCCYVGMTNINAELLHALKNMQTALRKMSALHEAMMVERADWLPPLMPEKLCQTINSLVSLRQSRVQGRSVRMAWRCGANGFLREVRHSQ